MATTVFGDELMDQGLDLADTDGTRLDILTTVATDLTEATSTFTLGFDTVNTGAPEAGDTDGRKVVVPAITAGSVTLSGLATHWALSGVNFLASGTLSSSVQVTSGNAFTLDAINITHRDSSP